MSNKRLVVIVDYGVSNLFSIKSALNRVADSNTCIEISNQAQRLNQADAIVFPGQGAAAVCMQNLEHQPELIEAIRQAISDRPFLGICMGLQVLLEHSEENGGVDCLGFLSGLAKRFDSSLVKVPHMGWNTIRQKDHPLWHGIADGSYFYFVHSYYADSQSCDEQLGVSDYQLEFSSALGQANFFAIQAHPEKSGQVGLQLLKNFCHWRV